MDEELYSYDKWLGSDIYIIEDNDLYYGSVYENGTCYKDKIKSFTPEGCLKKCKAWVEADISKWDDTE